ncbi:unnamed protein product [Lampetra planeri]
MVSCRGSPQVSLSNGGGLDFLAWAESEHLSLQALSSGKGNEEVDIRTGLSITPYVAGAHVLQCVPPWAELAERLAVTSLQQRGGSTSCVVHIRAPAGHLVALNVTRLAAHGRAAPAAAPLVPQQHAPPLPPGLHVHASPAPSGPPAPYLPPGVASDVTTTPRAACALPWLEVRDGFPDGEGPPSASPRLLRICSERPASAGAPAAPSAAAPFRSVLSSRSELTLEFQWAGASATEGSVAAAEFQATVTFTECKFRCRDGQCVSSSLMRCDGASQCADASDEEGCSPGTDQPSHRSLQAETVHKAVWMRRGTQGGVDETGHKAVWMRRGTQGGVDETGHKAVWMRRGTQGGVDETGHKAVWMRRVLQGHGTGPGSATFVSRAQL